VARRRVLGLQAPSASRRTPRPSRSSTDVCSGLSESRSKAPATSGIGGETNHHDPRWGCAGESPPLPAAAARHRHGSHPRHRMGLRREV